MENNAINLLNSANAETSPPGRYFAYGWHEGYEGELAGRRRHDPQTFDGGFVSKRISKGTGSREGEGMDVVLFGEVLDGGDYPGAAVADAGVDRGVERVRPFVAGGPSHARSFFPEVPGSQVDVFLQVVRRFPGVRCPASPQDVRGGLGFGVGSFSRDLGVGWLQAGRHPSSAQNSLGGERGVLAGMPERGLRFGPRHHPRAGLLPRRGRARDGADRRGVGRASQGGVDDGRPGLCLARLHPSTRRAGSVWIVPQEQAGQTQDDPGSLAPTREPDVSGGRAGRSRFGTNGSQSVAAVDPFSLPRIPPGLGHERPVSQETLGLGSAAALPVPLEDREAVLRFERSFESSSVLCGQLQCRCHASVCRRYCSYCVPRCSSQNCSETRAASRSVVPGETVPQVGRCLVRPDDHRVLSDRIGLPQSRAPVAGTQSVSYALRLHDAPGDSPRTSQRQTQKTHLSSIESQMEISCSYPKLT